MACDKCPSPAQGSPGPERIDKGLSSRALQWTSAILPEGSALLSSSCCWLPAVLDFVFAGSITAAGISHLRPIFLAISVLTLAWRIMREGFDRRNVRRAIICACLVAWAQYKQPAQGHHSCH